jgi:prepilin-type N-terminal cleavage/methylation domain-containing protein
MHRSTRVSVLQQQSMGQRGFSLIELLIAVVLLALTAISLMALFPTGLRQITKAGRTSVINHLAVQKIDELMQAGYGSPDLTAGIHPTTNQFMLTDPDLSNYSLKWTVTDNTPFSDPPTKTVVVEVGYLLYQTNGTPDTDHVPVQQRETFVTYITQ